MSLTQSYDHPPSLPSSSPYAQPRSARSSASSNAAAHPLTPVYELDAAIPSSSDSAIASSSGSSADGDDAELLNVDEDATLGSLKNLNISPRARARIHDSPPLPNASFSFGTCPSAPAYASTPTAEYGPFDYPLAPGSSSSASSYIAPGTHSAGPSSRRGSLALALGQTHRRGSIVAHTRAVDSSASNIHSTAGQPFAPTTRRSSTCSTITTLPAGGRRPSILHSASTASGAAPPPLFSGHPSPSVSNPGSTISPPPSRRGSLRFVQKPTSTPIPPSLLARRGSLPAAQLFGVPLSEMAKMGAGHVHPVRASFAGQGGVSGAIPGYTTTTSALYARRASMADDSSSASGRGSAEDGASPSGSTTSSTSTITALDDFRTRTERRRSSLSLKSFTLPTPQADMPVSPRAEAGSGAISRHGSTSMSGSMQTPPAYHPTILERRFKSAGSRRGSHLSEVSLPGDADRSDGSDASDGADEFGRLGRSPASRYGTKSMDANVREDSAAEVALESPGASGSASEGDETVPTPGTVTSASSASSFGFTDPWAAGAGGSLGACVSPGEMVEEQKPRGVKVVGREVDLPVRSMSLS